MDEEPYVAVGRVTKTHGLRGEVSVVSDAGASLASLAGSLAWFVPPPKATRCARILSARPGPKGTLLTFEGVTSIDDASLLVGCDILVSSECLPDEWRDVDEPGCEGFLVFDSLRGELGRIEETIVTGANDVWVVRGPLGEVLVPVIADVVDRVDPDARRVEVTLLPGLIEDDES